MHYEVRNGDLLFSDDKSRIDVSAVHAFLTHSYWAEGRSVEIVKRSIDGSVCVGLYERDRQIGFARVVTDSVTFAFLCDVFVIESHRGRGLGRWMMECLLAHPLLGSVSWLLRSTNAASLYKGVGFEALPCPESWMRRPNR